MTLPQEANNIINGPWQRKEVTVDPTITFTQNGTVVSTNRVALVKHTHICDTLLTVMPLLFNNIELAGFNIDSESIVKDVSLIVESIKSVLCKQYDIYHPIQDIANALLLHDEVNGLVLATRIELDLKTVEPMVAVLQDDSECIDALEE